MPEVAAGTGLGERSEPRGVLPAGTRLRTYELISVLGQGGFGITYLARDIQLHREVAIKEYLPTSLALREDGTMVVPRSTELAEDFVWGRERFLDEARTLAKLEGAPAVVRVIDFLEDNGTAYTVMALARGETLDQRLRREGPLSALAVERLLDPLLDGLERVHAAGFLHRDIKPANIIVDEYGAPTLIDFGASRAAIAGRSTALTAIFTPGYAAAEQFTSASQGPWTDIYGLSATLYHAITGKAPPSAFDRMLEDAYQPLGQLLPAGFAPGLLAGIDTGLAVRTSHRPQAIADWRSVLRGEAAPPATGEATVVLQRTTPPQTSRLGKSLPVARRRQLIWAGVAALFVLVAAAGFFGRSLFEGPAVQSLTAEELSRALEERRKADALAAEKKKLEEEASRQAASDAEAKRKADAELAAAQELRQKAEQELAKLRAEIEAQKKAAEEARQKAAADAQRLLEEAQQKKTAEAEMAALRKTEEEAKSKAAAEVAAQQAASDQAQRKAEAGAAAARAAEEAAAKKAAADAEAKRLADEALARAQAERQKADEEAAKQQAALEAKQKAEVDAKSKADAEAKAAAEKKAAEAAESSVKLAVLDRQHLQVALTSLGFDTRGNDGAFGPRSREMIAAWQKARKLPETGFLDASQQQALLKEGATSIDKYDAEQKKLEEDKKKAEEEAKKKAEEEAKKKEAAGVYSSAAPQPQTEADRQRQKEQTDKALDALVSTATPTGRMATRTVPASVEAQVAIHSNWGGQCSQGRIPTVKIVTPPANGSVSVRTATSTVSCGTTLMGMAVFYTPKAGFSGTDTLSYDLSSTYNTSAAGLHTVSIIVQPPAGASSAPPTGTSPAASSAPAPATPTVDGVYSGSFVVSDANNRLTSVELLLEVINSRGRGSMTIKSCGGTSSSFSVEIASAGDVTGGGSSCRGSFTVRGRVDGGRLRLSFAFANLGSYSASLSRAGR